MELLDSFLNRDGQQPGVASRKHPVLVSSDLSFSTS